LPHPLDGYFQYDNIILIKREEKLKFKRRIKYSLGEEFYALEKT